MSGICSCDDLGGNLGGNPCSDGIGVLSRLILVPKYDESGAVNNFADISAVTKSALQAKFDNAVVGDRFFATPVFDQVVNERSETTFFEADSGAKYRVKEGVRTFTAQFLNQGTPLLAELEKFTCNSLLGFYGIDQNGNFIYQQCDGEITVDPIEIQRGSWDASYVWAKSGEPSMVTLTFSIKESSDDSKLKWESADNLDFDGLENNDVYGLLNGNVTYNTQSTTVLNLTLKTDYNTLIKGLIQTDFALYNVTTASAVTISAFDETPAGTYDLTYAAQTASDVLRLTPTKAKYDFAKVVAKTATLS
jgi:hypothetical protein